MSIYEELMHSPEPMIEPPEDFYVEADCGHEVYHGESIFLWGGLEICPDCLREKIDEMSLEEIATALGVDYTPVERRRHV